MVNEKEWVASDRLPWVFTMLIYFVKISRSGNKRYRAYQRWRCRELCSTLSQIIRLKASDDACLLNQSRRLTKSMEKSLDTCNSRILLIALNILQKQHTTNNKLYSDLWKLNERTREACHPKLCCSGQQEKPLTVEEELKTLYLLLTTWWTTLIWNQFKKSNCNNRQDSARGGNLVS